MGISGFFLSINLHWWSRFEVFHLIIQ
jgi:hypothetical protein